MRRVAIAGVGLTPVKEHWEVSIRELFAEAALKALDEAGTDEIDALYISNMGSALLQRQLHLGAMMADALGARGIDAVRVEAASASGGVAFHEGVKAVASGLHDCVLVGGVEKMSDALPGEIVASLAMAEDQEYTAYTGVTKVGLCALIHRMYMERFGVGAEEIAMFAVRGHEHAVGCPHAQYPFKVSIERVLASPMEADPIHILECSGIGDGAAAVLLRPAGEVEDGVEVASTAVATGVYYLTERADPLAFDAVRRAAARALEASGVSHDEIDVLEVHDDTTIAGVVSLEDLGFVGKGEGAGYVAEGNTARDGELPTNTFGGLKARGNPLGATGLYQIAEVAMQIRGEAGRCQVDGAETGMAQSMGGLGSTCAVAVLRRG
ncbi:MAG: beta-ketoacyl synthase N-terminal-like domain-containing protein [Candidatus Bathyarchaeia archaeon]